eukprot:gene8096-8289_t
MPYIFDVWNNLGWRNGTDHCTWSGVFCDNTSGTARVVSIWLKERGLYGPLPTDELGQLNKWLDGNPALSGQLDPTWSDKLPDLMHLLPDSFAKLINLRTVALGRNLLEGTIPASYVALKDLISLNLSYNKLVGDLKDLAWLGQLTKLEWLQLDYNGFTGSPPEEWGSLTKLQVFRLNGNSGVGGPLPVYLERFNGLRFL